MNFESLFLGLVLGTQTVMVQVADPVERVELLLDGQSVAEIVGPPWRGQVDLGRDLLPHELVAVAYDANDSELDRATQWLNLPRQPAETHILLERDETGRAVSARVSWESLVDDRPSAIRAEFDGIPLEPGSDQVIALPPHDPELLHFLRVEVEFGEFVLSQAEVTFGGTYRDEVNSELTAIPIELVGRRRPPKAPEMQNALVARDRGLRVAAIEKGPVDVVMVRDQGAWPLLRQVRSQALTLPLGSSSPMSQSPSASRQWFQPNDTGWYVWSFQLLWPVPRRRVVGDNPYDLFTHSSKYLGEHGSLQGWLTTVLPPEDVVGSQRLADAVAVAGVTAAGSNRRRAVLLVLGPQPQDISEVTPEVVRRYLEALGVPLFVWRLDPAMPRETAWGESVDVSTPKLMDRASSRIFHQLKRQRIVWVEGRHLPHQVSITEPDREIQILAVP